MPQLDARARYSRSLLDRLLYARVTNQIFLSSHLALLYAAHTQNFSGLTRERYTAVMICLMN